jgi:hypothetical protein
MSFLSRAARNEDNFSASKHREESYKLLFPKIGRDFVTRADLEAILRSFCQEVGVLAPITDFLYDGEARALAHTYADLVERGQGGKMVREDLIKMDDD